MTKVFISTIPFASTNKTPIDLLEKNSIYYEINSFGRKITEEELFTIIKDFDVLIAGTEPITRRVIDNARKLKVISRVGVGVDNIDLEYAAKKNIAIKTSSLGPVNAVAEYTLGLILSMLRHIHIANYSTKQGIWKKNIGKDLSGSVVGVLGAGNIGNKVIELVSVFSPKNIMFYDPYIKSRDNATKSSLKEILKLSDIITLHLPLSGETKNLISSEELQIMKNSSIIINTSRGEIINEEDLYWALKNNVIAGSALDVFKEEPYKGKLAELDNCLISPHMAPMTEKAREAMELDAIVQSLDYLKIKNQ